MTMIPTRRVFDAAVLHEGDPGADECARLVPAHAKLLKAGKVVLGYKCEPKRRGTGKFSAAEKLVTWLRACQDLMLLRHWHRPPTVDEARAFAGVVAVAAAGHDRCKGGDGNTTRLGVQWLRTWCAVLGEDEIERIVTHAVFSERHLKATRIGDMLKLTADERDLLAITTIRVQGTSDEDQEAARRERDRLDKAAKRAAKRATNPKPAKPEKTLDEMTASQRRRRITADRKREADEAGAPRPKRGRPKAANGNAQKPVGSKSSTNNKSIIGSDALLPTQKCAFPQCQFGNAESPQDLKSERAAREAEAPAYSHPAVLSQPPRGMPDEDAGEREAQPGIKPRSALQACGRRTAPPPFPPMSLHDVTLLACRIRHRMQVAGTWRGSMLINDLRMAQAPPHSGCANRSEGAGRHRFFGAPSPYAARRIPIFVSVTEFNFCASLRKTEGGSLRARF